MPLLRVLRLYHRDMWWAGRQVNCKGVTPFRQQAGCLEKLQLPHLRYLDESEEFRALRCLDIRSDDLATSKKHFELLMAKCIAPNLEELVFSLHSFELRCYCHPNTDLMLQ